MVTLFHDMMHKEIEVYVDDMIAKSQTEDEHIVNLEKLFQRMRNFRLRLNLAKCESHTRTPSPSNVKREVRGFLGRLNYIAHFISQLTEKCDLVFRLLQKNNLGTWDEDAKRPSRRLKSNCLTLLSWCHPFQRKP
ncbi:hypothetical protein GQ457_11G028790 [Hibiscus cannabinus]